MSDFKTILVPHDFSPHSDSALDTAIELARALGSRITLVHVYHQPTLVFAAYDIQPATPFITEVPKAAQERLDREVAKVVAAGIEASGQVIEGTPAETIVAAAEDADLVVMGTQGLTGLPHVLLGSVTERTVRLAGCPVLTVKGPAPD